MFGVYSHIFGYYNHKWHLTKLQQASFSFPKIKHKKVNPSSTYAPTSSWRKNLHFVPRPKATKLIPVTRSGISKTSQGNTKKLSSWWFQPL